MLVQMKFVNSLTLHKLIEEGISRFPTERIAMVHSFVFPFSFHKVHIKNSICSHASGAGYQAGCRLMQTGHNQVCTVFNRLLLYFSQFYDVHSVNTPKVYIKRGTRPIYRPLVSITQSMQNSPENSANFEKCPAKGFDLAGQKFNVQRR